MDADYILKLKNGQEIKLLYLFSTFRRMSERLHLEYEDMMNGVLPKDKGGTGDFLKLNNVPRILLEGAETYCRANNEPFTYTMDDADIWMDDIDWSSEGVLSDIYVLFSCKLFKMDKSKIMVKNENGEASEKKKRAIMEAINP